MTNITDTEVASKCIAVIAHVDHGKTTLLQCISEKYKSFNSITLDGLESEKLHGVTIKIKGLQITFQDEIIFFVDTPGHIDFHGEVFRGIFAADICLLLVDVTQGIQAQTIHYLNFARKLQRRIIVALNKIDAFGRLQQIDEIMEKLAEFEISSQSLFLVSGKTGEGIENILEAISKLKITKNSAFTDALLYIIDSQFDKVGEIKLLVRVFHTVSIEKLKVCFEKSQIKLRRVEDLSTAKINLLIEGNLYHLFVTTPQKSLSLNGKLVFENSILSNDILSESSLSLVSTNIFPELNKNYEEFEKAITRLLETDPTVRFFKICSVIYSRGYKLYFSGLFHMEIFLERLKERYSTFTLALPSVDYKVILQDNTELTISEAEKWPDLQKISKTLAPIVLLNVSFRLEDFGAVEELLSTENINFEKREISYSFINTVYLNVSIPLERVLTSFMSNMRAVTHGHCTVEINKLEYKEFAISKLLFTINDYPIYGLSLLCLGQYTLVKARHMVEVIKSVIPRRPIEQKIRALVNGKIVASTRLSAMANDIFDGLYAMDKSRKAKLIKRQREGKRIMTAATAIVLEPSTVMKIISKS